jgi:hypothetical protein
LKRDSDYLQFRPYKAIVASPIKGRPSPIAGGRSNLVDFAVRSEPGRRGRSRVLYLVLAVAVIGTGLLWRSQWLGLPPFISKYGGSALWSLMVFLFCGLVMPRVRTWVVTAAALVIAYGVELGQLYHAPWIDNLREYPLGALILGNTFAWPDLIGYTVGVLIGASLEKALRKRETETWL